MDIEKLIKRLKCPKIQSCPMNREDISCKACQKSIRQEVITAFSTLQAENKKLRDELEQVKAERDEAIDCIYQIEDDLNRGNDNDWAREHIAEWESQKED